MPSLMFLGCFDQKLSKKNFWGVGSTPLVKEGLKGKDLVSMLSAHPVIPHN